MQRPAKPFTPVRFRLQPPLNKEMKKEYIVISGGFDPIHSGHINLIQDASKVANVIAIVNNNNFLINKKGFIFLDQNERIKILSSITGVDETFLSIDNDHTVINSLKKLINSGRNIKYFGNGGDRMTEDDIPETEICKKNNIELIFNLGGQKSQSSSSLAVSLYDQLQKKNSESNYVEKPWGFYKTFISEDEYLLKKIYINPGEELSEQSHNHRDEHWIIVSGKVTVLSDKKMQEKEKNDHIFISRNTKHKIINHQDEPAVIIEVQTGVILSEDDIIRYNDEYKRS